MALHVGVFSLGQIWTVTRSDGFVLGFPDRLSAVSAAMASARAATAVGDEVTLSLQDELGVLRRADFGPPVEPP